ncbi:MAG: TOMM precursor leader peptide-binding protein [Candidatus Dormibacteria bacterium]
MLRGKGFAERVAPLIDALDGTSTVDELGERFPDLVPAVLDGLLKRGLLIEGDPEGDHGAPALTAAALAEFAPPGEVRQRLSRACVAVVGCGPVSATAAMHLAKAGVGRLLLCDGGQITAREVIVSPNLSANTAGCPRADSVQALCHEAGGVSVEVVNAPLESDLITTTQLLLIEARYGRAPCAPEEADVALAKGVPYMVHSQDALEAIVGPVVRPGGEPCHHCVDSRRLSHVNDLDEFLAYREQRGTTTPMPDAFLAAHTSFVAGLVANEALRVLVKAPQRTEGGALVIDLATMTLEREEVLLVPGCPGCATAPSDD